METTEIGGGALVLGSLLVLLVFFRDPASGVAAATQGVQSVFFFVLLPVLGLLAGIYAYAGGPYSALGLFLLGTYIGVVGLGLLLGALLATGPVGLPLLVGLVLFSLSLVTLLTSLLRSTSSIQLETLFPSFD